MTSAENYALCYFITGILAAGGDVERVRSLADSHGIGWKRIENSSVQQVLLPGDTYYYTTRAICDCGTSIGSAIPLRRRAERLVDPAEVEKLRKKGWSPAKIHRWTESRRADNARKQLNAEERLKTLPATTQRWHDLFRDAISSGATPGIGLLLHFYRNGVENEQIKTLRREMVPSSELSNEFLLEVREDIVYVFMTKS